MVKAEGTFDNTWRGKEDGPSGESCLVGMAGSQGSRRGASSYRGQERKGGQRTNHTGPFVLCLGVWIWPGSDGELLEF